MDGIHPIFIHLAAFVLIYFVALFTLRALALLGVGVWAAWQLRNKNRKT